MQRGLTVNRQVKIDALRLEYLSLSNDKNIQGLSSYSMSLLDARIQEIRNTLADKYGVSAR